MNTIKNIFTMLMLRLIKFLLGFSSRLVPLLIIALALLKLAKIEEIKELDLKYIIAIIVLEAVLIIFNLIFDSLFLKNEKEEKNKKEEFNETDNNLQNKKFSVLNTVSAFFGFLTLIFILLKLFKAISWQWIWVLSPLWLSTALIISILIIAVIIFIISLIAGKGKSQEPKEEETSKKQ